MVRVRGGEGISGRVNVRVREWEVWEVKKRRGMVGGEDKCRGLWGGFWDEFNVGGGGRKWIRFRKYSCLVWKWNNYVMVVGKKDVSEYGVVGGEWGWRGDGGV